MLENQRKKYKEMDASKKKQMLNRKTLKSRKSYDSMDCGKKEKYLNAIRNQSAIARQNRKISKLHVDVCISQFCQKIKEGPYYVCTVCNRMLYRKSVLIFNNRGRGRGARGKLYLCNPVSHWALGSSTQWFQSCQER